MAFSYDDTGPRSVGDTITVPFGFISRDDVKVYVDGVLVSKNLYSWVNDGLIECLSGFPEGSSTRVARRTSKSDIPAEQSRRGVFDSAAANTNDRFLLYLQQEQEDAGADLTHLADQTLTVSFNVEALRTEVEGFYNLVEDRSSEVVSMYNSVLSDLNTVNQQAAQVATLTATAQAARDQAVAGISYVYNFTALQALRGKIGFGLISDSWAVRSPGFMADAQGYISTGLTMVQGAGAGWYGTDGLRKQSATDAALLVYDDYGPTSGSLLVHGGVDEKFTNNNSLATLYGSLNNLTDYPGTDPAFSGEQSVLFSETTSTAAKWATFPLAVTAGVKTSVTFVVKGVNRDIVKIFANSVISTAQHLTIRLSDGYVSSASTIEGFAIPVGGGKYMVTAVFTPSSTGTASLYIAPGTLPDGGRTEAYQGVVGNGIIVGAPCSKEVTGCYPLILRGASVVSVTGTELTVPASRLPTIEGDFGILGEMVVLGYKNSGEADLLKMTTSEGTVRFWLDCTAANLYASYTPRVGQTVDLDMGPVVLGEAVIFSLYYNDLATLMQLCVNGTVADAGGVNGGISLSGADLVIGQAVGGACVLWRDLSYVGDYQPTSIAKPATGVSLW